MKKLAIAAALAAFSLPVMAQNVSISGVIDTAVQNFDGGASSLTRMQDNVLSTSKLTFKGSEDLGGGLKAVFTLESTLRPTSGSSGSTSTTGQLFDREATVGLAGSFGEIRVGRQDVTLAQDVDFLTSQAQNFGFHAINGTGVELGFDQNNVVKYTTPSFGGFSAQLGYASGNNSGATSDNQADQQGVFLRYRGDRLKAQVGYQKNDGTTKAAQRDFTAAGVSYDFGFASVGVSHAEGDVSTTGSVTSKSSTASVRVPLSNGVSLLGVYAIAEDGTQSSNGKGTGYTVGLTKDLSKRTTLYAAYNTVDNEANSSMWMFGSTAPTSAGLDTSVSMVGIKHVF